MNSESKTLIISPGENLRFGQGRDYLMGKTQRMGPHTKINAIAAGIIQRYEDFEPDAQTLFQAGDAAGVGRTEAEQAESYALVRFPEMQHQTFVETASFDSSTMAENAHNFIHESHESGNGYDRVVLVDGSFRMRRAAGQMEAWGVPLDGTYDAEKVYVNQPGITESTKRRRKKIVRKLYWSPGMQFERAREFALNVLGKIDNRGMVTRQMTSRTRNNA